MANSFQNEIPKARVNITLDVDTGGAQEKKELPMKLLAMGNFSNAPTTTPLEEKKRIDVNKNNINDVLASF